MVECCGVGGSIRVFVYQFSLFRNTYCANGGTHVSSLADFYSYSLPLSAVRLKSLELMPSSLRTSCSLQDGRHLGLANSSDDAATTVWGLACACLFCSATSACFPDVMRDTSIKLLWTLLGLCGAGLCCIGTAVPGDMHHPALLACPDRQTLKVVCCF